MECSRRCLALSGRRSLLGRGCSSSSSSTGAPPPMVIKPKPIYTWYATAMKIERSDSFKLQPSKRKLRDRQFTPTPLAKPVPSILRKKEDGRRVIPLSGEWDDIRHNRYEFVRELGRGGFGKVILVEHLGTAELFTLKRVRPKDTFALSGDERLSLSHPFIVQLMGSFIAKREDGENDRVLLFEYCEGPMFSAFLRRAPAYCRENAAFFTAQIVLALQHLDVARITHRDVKPDNILIVDGGYVKLADFGLATRWAASSPKKKMCGTLQYMAPEMVMQADDGRAVDWWALGVMVHEMCLGFNPYAGYKNQFEVMLQVAYRQFELTPAAVQELESQGERGRHARDVIEKLLVRDPKERMKFVAEIKDHPFFQGLDWNAIVIKEASVPPPPAGALNISTEEDMAKLTTSIEVDLDLISQMQPLHAAEAFRGVHAKPPTTTT